MSSVNGVLLRGGTVTNTETFDSAKEDIDGCQLKDLAPATSDTPAGTPVEDESDSSNPNDPNETGDPSDPEEEDPTGTPLPEAGDIAVIKGSSLDLGMDGTVTVADTHLTLPKIYSV